MKNKRHSFSCKHLYKTSLLCFISQVDFNASNTLLFSHDMNSKQFCSPSASPHTFVLKRSEKRKFLNANLWRVFCHYHHLSSGWLMPSIAPIPYISVISAWWNFWLRTGSWKKSFVIRKMKPQEGGQDNIVCTVHHIAMLMTNEMHNSCNQFLFHSFFCLLYMFRTNLVVHHQEHGIIYCITQSGTIGTIVL